MYLSIIVLGLGVLCDAIVTLSHRSEKAVAEDHPTDDDALLQSICDNITMDEKGFVHC